MKLKNYIIIFGTLLSLILVVIVFSRLDWSKFFTALRTIHIPSLLLAGGMIMMIITLRALRWTLVARMPITKVKYFWQAANIGYLGNLIYPARAGEVLRVIAVHHFAQLALGHAVASAVMDRVIDMIIVGLFTMLVLWIHSHRIDASIGQGLIVTFIIVTLLLISLVILGPALYRRVQGWTFSSKWQWLQEWLLHALESIQAFRQTHHVFIILFLTGFIFLLDYFWIWQVMTAFGWSLPFEAGLTVGVFLLLSISLPSAPGYIGVYQVACVLALKLYGIDESQAVAYSIVLQLLTFSIMGVQGTLVMTYCGFNLSREHQRDLSTV